MAHFAKTIYIFHSQNPLEWVKGKKVDWLDDCLLHETTLIEYLNVFSRGDPSNTTESVIRLGYYI